MSDLLFISEEEEERQRAADPRNFAKCAAHVRGARDFAEQFLRLLALRRVRRIRANWEPHTLDERQEWRWKLYQHARKNEHALRRDAKQRTDRARARAFKICAANGVACEKWSEAEAQEIKAKKLREKLERNFSRIFPDRAT